MKKKLFLFLFLLVIIFIISSCYWKPESMDTIGSISIKIEAKDLPENYDGYAFHVDLWHASDISSYYPSAQDITITIEPDAEPIPINGELEYTVETPGGAYPNLGETGTIIFDNIEATTPYKIRIRVYYYMAGSQYSWDLQGLSDTFEVEAGGETLVDVGLYYPC